MTTEASGAAVDEYGLTRQQGWEHYFAVHPNVVASWGHQNGRWNRCNCIGCDPQERRPRSNIVVDP